jgi:hypothetical protein
MSPKEMCLDIPDPASSCGRARADIMSLPVLGKREHDFVINEGRERQPGTVGSRSLDSPGGTVRDNTHLAALAPPGIDIPRKRDPKTVVGQLLLQMLKERSVCRLTSFIPDVIGMNDETDEAVLLPDHRDLTLPEIDRIGVEDVEERVVLRRSQWKLEEPAEEEWHDRAAAAALGFEVSDARE